MSDYYPTQADIHKLTSKTLREGSEAKLLLSRVFADRSWYTLYGSDETVNASCICKFCYGTNEDGHDPRGVQHYPNCVMGDVQKFLEGGKP